MPKAARGISLLIIRGRGSAPLTEPGRRLLSSAYAILNKGSQAWLKLDICLEIG